MTSQDTIQISCNALQEIDTPVLLALTRTPWSSLHQIADLVQRPRDVVQRCLESVAEKGWVQMIAQQLSYLPKHAYAPTWAGIKHLAEALDLPVAILLKHLGYEAFRVWSLRSGLPVAREVAKFCAGLLRACRARGESLTYDAFVTRRYKGVELLIHARLQIQRGEISRAPV